MGTYIALFRGINVGGNNILAMKDLVRLLESLGCQQVKTYIQSGNAVIRNQKSDADALAAAIRAKVLADHGFNPHVLLLEAVEWEDAIRRNPFATDDGKALHFFFCESPPQDPDLAGLDRIKLGSEEFKLDGNVFYFHAPEGIGRSKLAARVEKALGVPVTARNWNTIHQLGELVKQMRLAE